MVKQKIAIIGAGWYGCHLALALKKQGHDVTIFEKNPDIFSAISGSFGIRLHTGLHYPRSPETRKNCRTGFAKFKEHYPELVVSHESAVYGVGNLDAEGKVSKVNAEQFLNIAMTENQEQNPNVLDPNAADYPYQNLNTAINVDEPSILLGKPLRENFRNYLKKAEIKVIKNFTVSNIKKNNCGKFTIDGDCPNEETFDKVINATSYQAHLPTDKNFPFEMEVVYQPCLGLIYEDTQSKDKPISFIVMDGWFPCLMPLCENEGSKFHRDYILTHGKYTIMGSYATPEEAHTALQTLELNPQGVETHIKRPSEQEMKRFWPKFVDRFQYIGWKGQVLAKLKTKKEFRSAFSYEKDGIIHVFPGKISNVFDIENEVFALLKNENILENKGYRFVKDGVLDSSGVEIKEKPKEGIDAATTTLHTFEDMIGALRGSEAPPAYDSSNNYFFIMQFWTRMFTATTLIGAAILAYGLVGVFAASALAVTGVVMFGYSSYTFFAKNKETPKNLVDPLSVPIMPAQN